MLHTSTRTRAAALVAATPLLTLAVATPATAAPPSSTTSKTSGGQAWASWTEYDEKNVLGLPGDTHVGYLGVYQQPGFVDVYGEVQDYDCDPGEVPGGGHGEPGGPGFCDLVGTRFISDNGTTFTVSRTGATLTGNLAVGGGHGDPTVPTAFPPVSITWTHAGGDYSFRRSETWSDGVWTYRSRTTGAGFQATVDGRIGGMLFTDDGDDVSSGGVESWRESSRTRTK